MARVSINDVVMRYEGAARSTLDHLDLEIADGEFFVLLGPSGCGKSTLLKAIAGLQEPDDGTIALDERVINFVDPGERDVAMVFQNYALYPHMTVRANIAFPLKMRRKEKAQAADRVLEAARHLELEELLDRNVNDLSGGQRQRVAVARALVREPSVMLMDEPLSNLDARLRLQTREALLALHREVRRTVIYVTHDQVEAMTMGDRIGVMNQGVLEQVGTPEEIYARPRSRFVAGFVGSPPMNFLRGEIVPDGDALAFAGLGLRGRLTEEQQRAIDANERDASWTAGIRPEHVRATSCDAGDGAWRITHVERLGTDGVLVVRPADETSDGPIEFDRERFRVRVAEVAPFRVDQYVELALQPGMVHLFDADGTSATHRSDGATTPTPAAARAREGAR